MLHDLSLGEEFFAAMAALDAKLAALVAAAGCRHCGGPLHRANYPRKPRGGLIAVAGEAFGLRHSLCCGREGCRRRTLPPSLRFLGRRVYVEAVVLLASMAAQVLATFRAARQLTGVPVRTLRRWATWWREAFPRSRTWVELRARLKPPPPDETELPSSLLDRLRAELVRPRTLVSLGELCHGAARLLAPITTSSLSDVASFVREVGGDPMPS